MNNFLQNTNIKGRFILWNIVVILLGILFLWQLNRGVKIETNILELLPASEKDPVVEYAIRNFTGDISQKILFLVGHDDENQALAAAKIFASKLSASDAFQSVIHTMNETEQKAFYTLFFPYRYQLLSPQTKTLLTQKEGGGAFLAKQARTLHSPISVAFTGLLEQDPLLFFPEFMQSFSRPAVGNMVLREGAMVTEKDGVSYVLITAVSQENAFARKAQYRISDAIDEARQQMLVAHGESKLITTGVFSFAKETSDTMEHEISMISLGSLIGILLLMIITFRSLKQFLGSMIPILVGVLAAFSISFLIFPNLHLLTLVFGASLIGICVDYSFHFFSEQLLTADKWRPEEGLQTIFPGITLGAITSIMGYLGLFIAPFPGLRQMAVFSSIGLLGAYGSVVCWYPIWFTASIGSKNTFFLRLGKRYISIWERHLQRLWLVPLFLILIILIITGLYKLKPNDDIRQLHPMPSHLIENEKWVMNLTSGFDTGRFFVVEGKTVDGILTTEEAMIKELEKLCGQHVLGGYQGVSEVLPSRQSQQKNRRIIQNSLLSTPGMLREHMASLGFSAQSIDKLIQQLSSSPEKYLTLDPWLSSPASTPFRHLWLGSTPGGYASVILLREVKDDDALENLETNFQGVHYINQSNDFSELLRRYRVLASRLVVLSYIVIVFCLMIRYGIRRGILVILPPILAALFVLAYLGLNNQNFNLFNILALLLVLGIGIDYTIFFAEAKTSKNAIMLAIMLSACTTILSFGLLSLSKTPVLNAFGETVLIGIGISLLLAPLAQKKERDAQ